MNLFTRNNKETTLTTNGLGEYIKYSQSIMLFPEDKKKSISKLKEEYTIAILSIISYLREFISDSKLDNPQETNSNPLDLDFKSMLAKCPSTITYLIRNQELPSIINIIDNQHMPHIHVSGETIEMAEYFELLPGLNHILTNDYINKIFNGLNIFKAKALLDQMNLLPPNNQFDMTLDNYNQRVNLHRLLIRDIVENLINSKNPHDITRARIFLSYFDVEYVLPEQDTAFVPPKKLEYKNPDC